MVFIVVRRVICPLRTPKPRAEMPPSKENGIYIRSIYTRLRSSPSCNKAFGANTNDRSSDSSAEKETNRTEWSHPVRTTTTPPSTFPSPQQTSYRPVR
ncbi:hypothetical protein AVEN_118819-1 [Araneus ventricosus]|uniref:Uncharacterized protein n=1 Tax=Araneus ventricosus TaxID=182803 RepID=A0A4Y2S6S9_ARAVE|nr:hypothetical protein AVEN_156357-1 [Araneus ventricosus]GBN66768.1 hypothetical protein AVEN_13996-1 [Araneus ventricosus]GBN83716.1 hypothetical protein AVEN_2786-1 [Araneus ventricosus]GBN83717.1 hypothetical protein AVEN_118819-1 [Araneus ventricosus]